MSFRRHGVVFWLWPLVVAVAPFSAHGFNNDGQTGIVWQNEATRESAVWFLKQTSLLTAGWLTNNIDADWRIAAVADFNRDGHPDLFWRSLVSGGNEIWLMNGTNQVARQSIAASLDGFDVVGAGDFDADGYPDLLWRDTERNLTAVWFLDGANWNGRASLFSSETDFRWNVAATADFNNDGYADIIWRDRYSGRIVLWLLQGMDLLKSVDLPLQRDRENRLVGTGAFNLLGNTDLLWRHANGQNTVWMMSGTQYLSSAALPSVTIRDWRIAGTGGYTNGMRLSAVANEQATNLTLVWRYGSLEPPAIEMREFGQTNWSLLATNYIPYRCTNSAVRVGQRYEYRVGGEYLLTGNAAAPIEDRGRIVLVVEESLASQIPAELELLNADLVGDGWSVIRTNAPRHNDDVWSQNLAAIASIKSFITNAYSQDRVRTKAVYLLGHVPIPYSGFLNPDGHGSRALPADVYYGDMDGLYTDSAVNYGSFLQGPHLLRHDNFIGDGKFDQNRIPANAQGVAELELAVGRADFSNLPSFAALSEAQITQRYIQKAHRYRHRQFTLPDRVLVATYFPSGSNRDTYAEALKIGSRLFGTEPGAVLEGDPFDRNNPALWGLLGGFGLPFGIFGNGGEYHQSAEMPYLGQEPRLAFASVFASFLLDFHYPDNFMRAFLATPSYGLAITWFKPVSIDRISLAFETLGLGETIGNGFVRSVNASQRMTSENTFIALLGDPTLRLQVLAPPGTVTAKSESNVSLEWTPPIETSADYFVYRSTNRLDGPWVRLTSLPIAETRFTDNSAPSGRKMYQVRSVKLTATGSGSYTNLSQGVYVEVP